uniref:Uncharacterized protein n=1 Tax=Knipowitschia caucasica TaxID=637954 RepID=A0AAV2L0J5_KNICA
MEELNCNSVGPGHAPTGEPDPLKLSRGLIAVSADRRFGETKYPAPSDLPKIDQCLKTGGHKKLSHRPQKGEGRSRKSTSTDLLMPQICSTTACVQRQTSSRLQEHMGLRLRY